jgi:hypothetical protein
MIAQPHLQLVGAAAKADRAARSAGWLTPSRVARWLSVRHSLAVEAVVVLGLYATYEAARGLVVGDRRVAVGHAQTVASLERSSTCSPSRTCSTRHAPYRDCSRCSART